MNLNKEHSKMALNQKELPQMRGGLFLTDGGIETTLIFHRGLDLPAFAAYRLLRTEDGTGELARYFRGYARLAAELGTSLILESPTWRANRDWGAQLGDGEAELEEANVAAIALLREIRAEFSGSVPEIVISGCVGPRGDGYVPSARMTAEEAEVYHGAQVTAFAQTGVDLVTGVTINYVEEAIGIVRAAMTHRVPVVVSFTVETDGRLPTGQALGEAIEAVDRATAAAASYYMINCAHPTHFIPALEGGTEWMERIRGVRANASSMSHAELNEATELDEGDPEALAALHIELLDRLPRLNIVGGCCGTDERHVRHACLACLSSGHGHRFNRRGGVTLVGL